MAEHVKQAKGKQSLIQERKHGILLTIVLWFYMILHLSSLLIRLSGTGKSYHIGQGLHYQTWMGIPLSIFHSSLSFIWCFAIWKWKKWGVYGLFSASAIFSILSIYRGIQFAQSAFILQIIGVISYNVFILLLFRVWKYFD